MWGNSNLSQVSLNVLRLCCSNRPPTRLRSPWIWSDSVSTRGSTSRWGTTGSSAAGCMYATSTERVRDSETSTSFFKGQGLSVCLQAYDQHLNMILGDVEETVTTVEIDEETYEELYKVTWRRADVPARARVCVCVLTLLNLTLLALMRFIRHAL